MRDLLPAPVRPPWRWPERRWSALLSRLGVTRVARVTGLDRSGVEVACAVRPRGHVLQVCNGKGRTFAAASAGAVLEAAELWGAERLDPLTLAFGSSRELRGAGLDPWDAADLGSAGRLVAPELWGRATRCAFRRAVELVTGREVWIPAGAVHCPPAGSIPLGPSVVRWTSNGSGAHPSRRAALSHALCEAVERDQLARALPDGWTRASVRERMLDPGSLSRSAPAACRLARELARRGFDLFLFDLAPARRAHPDLGLPVGGALLFDRESGAIPLTAGYACALRRDEALAAAILEAAQSRLTDIHGARDDVAPSEPGHVERLRAACAGARPRRRGAEMPDIRESPRGRAERVLERLRRAGLDRVAAVDLAPPDLGIHVVKVVIPGLQVSELL